MVEVYLKIVCIPSYMTAGDTKTRSWRQKKRKTVENNQKSGSEKDSKIGNQ
jgi:hypothetical protein